MLSFLKGILVEKALESPQGAYFLIDVHGVGYLVLSSDRSVQAAPHAGAEVQVFTSLIVREDSMSLVGFYTREERDLFNILQNASGVGTKVALSLLSFLSVTDIAQAVVSNNHVLLTKAKGVGSKLAQKITLELKEKMMNWRSPQTNIEAMPDLPTGLAESFTEAESVLLSLGYQPGEVAESFLTVRTSLDRMDLQVSSETILRESLRWLAQAV